MRKGTAGLSFSGPKFSLQSRFLSVPVLTAHSQLLAQDSGNAILVPLCAFMRAVPSVWSAFCFLVYLVTPEHP